MALARPELFVASTTLARRGQDLSVVKYRLPLRGPSEWEHETRHRAREATIAEAAWLSAARHPATVQLKRVDPAFYRLETVYAGRQSLQTAIISFQEAMLALSEIAAALAVLHQEGFVHGRLTLDHLIMDRRRPGRVLLCSPRGGSAVSEDDRVGLLAVAAQLHDRVGGPPSKRADLLAAGRAQSITELARTFDELGRARLTVGSWIRSQVTNTSDQNRPTGRSQPRSPRRGCRLRPGDRPHG